MSAKLGRNDPCWCGSGQKYKKCHLERGGETPVTPWEVDAHIRSRDKTGACLHVGAAVGTICGKAAIGSHTVTKKMLKQIARKGHVYRYSATMQDLQRSEGRLVVKLIGINDASVLRVFCEPHDGEGFSALEQVPFTGSAQQCFLLHYRAVCHEYYKKKSVLEFIPTMKGYDRGKPTAQQAQMQAVFEAQAYGYRLSLRDLEENKQRLDSMLLAGAYADMRVYVVTFDTVPDLLCASAIYPQYDFSGKRLQNLADYAARMELVTFSLIATDGGGAFVFAWHASADTVCRPLATSLDVLSDHELPHAIVRFVFELCENQYLKPDWWDRIEQDLKDGLTGRLQLSVSAERRQSDSLSNDGLQVVSWKVMKRFWL